ncbi:YlxR family protein [Mycoplasma leonicaptivi]|uniref:YlxR family protein n=1 Tax=Mycoplasma leonicaptivi TaxID=36742 RepID=UPI0004803E3B|nr:YlxR family protein [Mycoplasma leonicaptivi]
MKTETNQNYTRKCIVTNNIINIDNLIRFDYNKKDNLITLDLNKSKKGRGAYFIPTQENWLKLKKTKALNRTFRTNVDMEVYNTIEQQLQEEELWQKKQTE